MRSTRGAVAERAIWGGLAMAGLSVVVLGLYSIYRLLSGVFIGTGAPAATGLSFVFLGVLALGVALSVGAFLILLLQARSERSDAKAESRTTIAA